MKILIIFTFYMISGPVDCSDVIGYSGGSVIIISNIKWYDHNSKYICKVDGKGCTDIIRADTKRHQVHDGRFMLYANTENFFLILIRKLKPQDAGTYRFGLGNQSNSTVNLKVHNNASCGVPKIMNAYLGQNITITCKYPGEVSQILLLLYRDVSTCYRIERKHSTSNNRVLHDDISSTERNSISIAFQSIYHYQCVCLCGSAADWSICTDCLQTETKENKIICLHPKVKTTIQLLLILTLIQLICMKTSE
ncbi:hypothetical protein PHYPO_G00068530 [Pangasianodon hypophthalmus]|uniref:Immunoglobulin V-set domain-containing protein n=1 Tax=Pangasianodon hypophthalmus TaxID=310915 RepID=A0A5N5LTI5_PANHP|nr:hypothetical protein PHYPO_G00068530 [Pangasianodon hypophthalmus]